MQMKNFLITLLAWLFPSVAMGQQGEWEQPWFNFGNATVGLDPIVAVHLIHLHTGKVIAINYAFLEQPCDPNCPPFPPNACIAKIYLWTPPPPNSPGNPGTFQTISNCRINLFCAGHSALADGRILTVGGDFTTPLPYADLFDPDLPYEPFFAWDLPSPPANMAQPRYYPTATTLGDGKVLATLGSLGPSGSPNVAIPELYTPGAPGTDSWIRLYSAELPNAQGDSTYPYMFLLPNGNLVKAGPGGARILAMPSPTDPSWGAFLPGPQWPPNQPPPPGWEGSAVMYEPGKIMKCGGLGEGGVGVTTTWVVDLNGADPYDPPPWLLAAGQMTYGRIHHNLVILPDGKVLVVGGQAAENGSAVYHPEIFDPASATWTLQTDEAAHARKYHSTAMLLRDGRVVSAGGDFTPTAQIFKPPYITSGAPRPSIVSAPTYMQYGQEYTISYLRNNGPVASKACLIRLAAVTHGFDQNQRRVPLSVSPDLGTNEPPSHIAVTAPLNGNIAPPGYYMLFILNEYAKNQFAPCDLASYVQVGP